MDKDKAIKMGHFIYCLNCETTYEDLPQEDLGQGVLHPICKCGCSLFAYIHDNSPVHTIDGILEDLNNSTDCIKIAPFTQKEITNLKKKQAQKCLHPYTCRECGTTLIIKPKGWYCKTCKEITQTWAHTDDTLGKFPLDKELLILKN
jgi:hypothetical protein